VASRGGVEVVIESLPHGLELVRVAGELDPASIADLESAFAASVASRRLVVDLSECTFLDSSAIHVLLAEAGRRREGDGELVIVVPSEAGIRRPLEIAQVDRMLSIHASVADAVSQPEP
jgi:anti-anti-sigma factor